jgi:hypothetical protein
MLTKVYMHDIDLNLHTTLIADFSFYFYAETIDFSIHFLLNEFSLAGTVQDPHYSENILHKLFIQNSFYLSTADFVKFNYVFLRPLQDHSAFQISTLMHFIKIMYISYALFVQYEHFVMLIFFAIFLSHSDDIRFMYGK